MPNSREGKSFSNNEVMALIESFRHDIRVIAEDVGSLKEDVHVLKEDMTEVKRRLTSIEDAIRLTIPRISKLEAKIVV